MSFFCQKKTRAAKVYFAPRLQRLRLTSSTSSREEARAFFVMMLLLLRRAGGGVKQKHERSCSLNARVL